MLNTILYNNELRNRIFNNIRMPTSKLYCSRDPNIIINLTILTTLQSSQHVRNDTEKVNKEISKYMLAK